MTTPIPNAQLQPPAGQNVPYTPSCTQLFPKAVEGGFGWGPKLDNENVTVWLTLPANYDVEGQPNAYQTLEEYGLCLREGAVDVPFVAVQEATATQETPTTEPVTDPLERLRQASQVQSEVEQTPVQLTPLEQRNQAVQEQATNPPVDIAPPKPGSNGAIGFLILILGVVALVAQSMSDRAPAPIIPDYQAEDDLPEEVTHIEHEQVAVTASPRVISLVTQPTLQPSPWASERNPYTATSFGSETSPKDAPKDTERLPETTRKMPETSPKDTEVLPKQTNLSASFAPKDGVVEHIMEEIRKRRNVASQPEVITQNSLSGKELEWGRKGSFEIDLDSKEVIDEVRAKALCFDLLSKGENATTRLMWQVFGASAGSSRLYQSGLPQQFIEQWKTQWEGQNE